MQTTTMTVIVVVLHQLQPRQEQQLGTQLLSQLKQLLKQPEQTQPLDQQPRQRDKQRLQQQHQVRQGDHQLTTSARSTCQSWFARVTWQLDKFLAEQLISTLVKEPLIH